MCSKWNWKQIWCTGMIGRRKKEIHVVSNGMHYSGLLYSDLFAEIAKFKLFKGMVVSVLR
jgi:hypothetical protein